MRSKTARLLRKEAGWVKFKAENRVQKKLSNGQVVNESRDRGLYKAMKSVWKSTSSVMRGLLHNMFNQKK